MMMRSNASWRFELGSLPHSLHGAQERFGGIDQFNDDLHLVHTLRGRGVLHTARGAFEATPDRVLAVPVFERCRWSKAAGDAWEMCNLHARLYDADGRPLHERDILPITFQPTDLPRIHRQLIRWQADWRAGGWREHARTAAGVMTLVADYLLRFGQLDAGGMPADPVMHEARRRVEQRASAQFDAPALAATASLSVSQFNRRFRAAWGMSPKSYWQLHRLKLAQTMLQGTTQSVGRVAMELGFGDIHYFSRWFTRLIGVPPATWRRQRRSI